tara:strand:+ start:40 stop:240 length:201 start_codon:yes stop_codon:yes gene_type:complete
MQKLDNTHINLMSIADNFGNAVAGFLTLPLINLCLSQKTYDRLKQQQMMSSAPPAQPPVLPNEPKQ